MVGLSSYLLIAFWWQRPSAVAAGKKAFVMNAIGDVGIALALFVIYNHVHSLSYPVVFASAHTAFPLGSHTANWVALLLLVGAVAKSAQLPLKTWLPDAMEGPTPVSALIHAATMVTRRRVPRGPHVAALRAGTAGARPGGADRRRDADDGRGPSPWCRSTSSASSRTPPCPRSATCSAAWGTGANAAGMFHLVDATRSSRPSCSSVPAW